MNLPTDVIIAPEKLTAYLLTPRPTDDKSRYLAQVGFTLANPDDLHAAILRLAAESEASEDGSNEYGTFFRVAGDLVGPNGRRLPVVTIWLRWALDSSFRFVTLKPDRTRHP
jgi:hypothetical protein